MDRLLLALSKSNLMSPKKSERKRMASFPFLERYTDLQVLSPFNSSSGATVFKARCNEDNKDYAIKVLLFFFRLFFLNRPLQEINKAYLMERHPERVEKWEERLRNELEALRATQGLENVVRFKESMEQGGSVYVVMELCRGKQLFDVVAATKQGLEEVQCARLFEQLVRGVRGIHAAGWIFRDLKGENILCCPAQGVPGGLRVKIVDFGAAKKLVHDPEHEMQHISLYASVSGTLAWNVCPERAYGEQESPAADAWALGVILYFMLVGNAPFRDLRKQKKQKEKEEEEEKESDEEEVIDRVLEEEIGWPAWAEEKVSREARELVEWLLEKEAISRPSLDQVLEHPWLAIQQGKEEAKEANDAHVVSLHPRSDPELLSLRQDINAAIKPPQ